ncbi:hypothetical protein D3C71_1514490 [compost metagenome]
MPAEQATLPLAGGMVPVGFTLSKSIVPPITESFSTIDVVTGVSAVVVSVSGAAATNGMTALATSTR